LTQFGAVVILTSMTGRGVVGGRDTARPLTGIHFLRADSGEFVRDALNPTTILASSRGLGWDGVVAETGREVDWQADQLTVGGHLIAMNIDSKPLTVEDKGPRGFTRVMMPPRSVWINPAGRPFTRRNPGITHYAVVEVSVDKVRRVLGGDVEFAYACGVADEPLAHVVDALVLEAKTGGASGPLFADSLGVAVASRLARRFGQTPPIASRRGALDSRLKMVLEKLEDTIAQSPSVDELAAVAGLSPAHFAREFKRCTCWTPHAFLMERRIQRARQMLAAGHSIADSAFACGFSDQPHLGRAFKKRFGATPNAFVRATKDASRRK
jgi:AraC family transcriptional regulator